LFVANILVLEDEVDVKTLLAEALRQHGYIVFEASTAAEAQRAASSHQLDAVVADIVLPGGTSGTDFAGALIRSQPLVRVLFVSGWEEHPSEEAADIAKLPEHSVRFLEKPFTVDVLVQHVDALLCDTRKGTA
jgi:DNA-binding response OmpR family regulator